MRRSAILVGVRQSLFFLAVAIPGATATAQDIPDQYADDLPELNFDEDDSDFDPADLATSSKTVPDYSPRSKVEGVYPRPTRRFSLFPSSMSFGAACRERCMPEMFSPRGIGVARRTGPVRMDYSPYVTEHTDSNHGPSYYQRFHLFPCRQLHHCEKYGFLKYGWPVYY